MKAKPTLIVLAAVIVAVAVVVGGVVLWSTYQRVPLPNADRCEASAGGRTTTVDLEQARNAAIISGVSIKRGLKPRAASIALATAYQESGMRNLDYGHADSLGLFQQRPSKGWGTEEQVKDPWYSSAKFYQAMVRIKRWETKDINDVAQAVQRSAYPEAYRKHVPRAKTLASALVGETPASFSCVVRSPKTGDPAGMKTFLTKTLGSRITITSEDALLRVRASNPQQAWAVAQLAIANTGRYGLASASVGTYSWTHSTTGLASWQGSPTATTEVALAFGQ